MPAKSTEKTAPKTASKVAPKTAARRAAAPAKPAAAVKTTAKKPAPGKRAAVKATPAVAAKTSKPATAPVKPVPKADAPAASKEKVKKAKLVRDSFTMPEVEYQVLGQVKKACIKAGFEVKKSELLRVGVALLQKTEVAQLQTILATLQPLKAGRPKKSKP